VFGSLAPPPDDFMDRIEPKLDRLLAAYSRLLSAAFAEAEAAEGDAGDTEKMAAVVEEIQSLMSVEGLADAGVTCDSTAVLYGNGLLPVLRVTLTDATLFDDAITRIEVAAGEQMPVAEVKDTPYRYLEDDGVRAILATVGNELVLTIAPAGLDDAALASLALEQGARLCTTDRDFTRFPGLKIVDPRN
jgi:predicted nucleic acid-binding protein